MIITYKNKEITTLKGWHYVNNILFTNKTNTQYYKLILFELKTNCPNLSYWQKLKVQEVHQQKQSNA